MNHKRVELVIDWEQLHQISDGNTEFERELLQIFVIDAQTHLEAAQHALATQNSDELSRAAHHVKGASANVGLTQMYAIATKLEYQAQRQQFTDAPVWLTELAEALEAVQTFLKQSEDEATEITD